MNKLHLTLFVLVVCTFNSFAQIEKSGSKVISSNEVIINDYTNLTQDALVDNSFINVGNSWSNPNKRFTEVIETGDLLFIIQMQGTQIKGNVNENSWGEILNYNNCGNNEFAEVKSINLNQIELVCPLSKSYSANSKTQVVKVPRYKSLRIENFGVLTSTNWDGIKGGLVVVEVNDSLFITQNSKIDVSGKGFRPGSVESTATYPDKTMYSSPNIGDGAEKGESIAGYKNDYSVYGGRLCRGAPANGGGGGDAINSSGGGGANAGVLKDYTGDGNPDISNPGFIKAWNLESNNFALSLSSGGGRGGYTWSYTAADPLTNPPNNPIWGSGAGDQRRNVGGKGGRPLDYSTGRLFLGGGGGAGDRNNPTVVSGPGGYGGGLVFVLCYGNIYGNGFILSNGFDGYSITNEIEWTDGTSGGGGGGTIVLKTNGLISSSLSLKANGGNGGNQYFKSPNNHPAEAEGGGGGGGGGYIAVSSGYPIIEVNGGDNGISQSPTMVNFPPNGGTKGGIGINEVVKFPNYSIVVHNDTICPGNNAYLKASFEDSTLSNSLIKWYSDLKKSPIATGPLYKTNYLFNDTSFYVMACPGGMLKELKVIVSPYTKINILSEKGKSFCEGDSTILSISKQFQNYHWSNGETTPTIVVSKTGRYIVEISDSNGCKGKDSIDINLIPVPNPVIISNYIKCNSDSAVLETENGFSSYKWYELPSNNLLSEGSNKMTIKKTGKYYVKVRTAEGCEGCSQSVDITISQATNYLRILSVKDNDLFDFGNVDYKQMICKELELENTGKESIILNNPYLYHNIAFSIPQSQLPFVVNPSEIRKLEVCYFASAFGIERDTLVIQDTCQNHLILLKALSLSDKFDGTSDCVVKVQLEVKDFLNHRILQTKEPYPNPGIDIVKLSYAIETNPNSPNRLICKLYNFIGNEIQLAKDRVKNIEVNQGIIKIQGEFEFDLSQYAQGFYYAVINSNDYHSVYLIVK